jgi:solute:Na+ symporter, SSS family
VKHDLNTTALSIAIVLFLIVTVLGFVAARWRRSHEVGLASLDEWGLGGRSFGTFVTWFLLGGDLYTAYTFVAVPGAMFALGAVNGWFAVPYTIIAYPLVFVFMPRLWSVSHRHQYATPADFVRGRHGSRTLALAVALTGVLATMPYIALQLVGIQSVLEVMGVGNSSSNVVLKDLPLIIAFAVLAAYTYSSGLRAPALIAFVKDVLIYIVIIVAIIYIPYKLGGFHKIFAAAETKLSAPPKPGKPKTSFIPGPKAQLAYATLALGSAMALFMYPHAITGVLSTRSRKVVQRNAAILPAYSLLLALIALLGYMAIAAGVTTKNSRLAVPLLFDKEFPDWFNGIAFGAIAIGALVPAAIMSIAAANLFTRNIYKEYLKPDATPAQEATVSKLASLVVKFGALAFVLWIDLDNVLNLQLLGGIWILQTFPAIVFGLYTRWFHRWALLAGWAVGMVYGTALTYQQVNPATGKHFGSQVAPIILGGDKTSKWTLYAAITAFVLNIVVAIVLTPLLRIGRVPEGHDETGPDDYTVDAGEPGVEPLPEPAVGTG